MADVRKGDSVSYRSMAGPVYEAVVTGIGPEGFVDLDVHIGGQEPIPLRAVGIWRVAARCATAAPEGISEPPAGNARHREPVGDCGP